MKQFSAMGILNEKLWRLQFMCRQSHNETLAQVVERSDLPIPFRTLLGLGSRFTFLSSSGLYLLLLT
jgi:hypothetical protein